MRKIIAMLLAAAMMFTLAACGNKDASGSSQTETKAAESSQPNEASNDTTGEKSDQAGNSGKTLVVYFSVPETTSADNMTAEEDYSTFVRNGEVLGNVQYVAYLIQENTGADIFRIEPVTPYPMNHTELEEVATQEKRDGAFPEISAQIENFADYDTVFVGYPNWYGDMPRIMYSMFENYDFSGKKVIPFVVSGGSGFSNTIHTITELESGAEVVKDGYSITRTKMEDAEGGVSSWLSGLGY